jgi:AAA domain, putative AbiEii toxin, Type IV TA system
MDRPKRILDEREKVWKRLLGSPASIEVKSIKIIESDVFAPQYIELRRVLAFIGLHGTGKTLLLRMLEAAFGYVSQVETPPFISGSQNRPPLPVPWQLDPSGINGILELEVKTLGGMVVRRVDLSEPDERRQEIWRDALGDSFDVRAASPLQLFNELYMIFQDYNSMLRSLADDPGKDLPKAKLHVLSNITGRSYDRVTVYSAHLADQEFGVNVPYITAAVGDQILDSSMMSQGELWVLYVLNGYLEGEANDGSLVLFDEPEAFLATRAQRPFIDQAARQALALDAQMLISTHSPEVLARFPLPNIRMCIPGNDGVRIIRPASMVQIRESIGIETPVRVLVLVEDELAREILLTLFARYDRALTREAEIAPAGGEAQVRNGIRILRGVQRLSCLGVLDGDKQAATGHPVLVLPGTSFPEDELVAAATREAGWLVSRMGVNLDDLMAAVSSCRGLDHQYWLKNIARSLGFEQSVITYEFIQAWLRDTRIAEEAGVLVRNIRAQVRTS